MKKSDMILIGAVIVVIIVSIFAMKGTSAKVTIDTPVTLTGEVGFNEMTYTEYETKMTNEEPFMVVIIQTGCSYCESFEPIVEETANEYNIPIYYLNMSNLTEDEYNSLGESNSYLKRNSWGTPTSLILVGDYVVDSIGGYVEKDSLVEFLEENVVLGEE